MGNILKEQWKRYRAGKSKIGVAFDILFIVLFIAMIIPSSRKNISSVIIKFTMSSPAEKVNREELSKTDYNWQYKTLQGETKNFADLKGKVIFFNLWATWCPPCIAEFPEINELYESYGDKVEFVLISNEEAGHVKAFLDKKGFSIPSNIPIQRTPEKLSSKSIPATFIISKNGEIVVKKLGAAKWNSDKTHALLDKLIAE